MAASASDEESIQAITQFAQDLASSVDLNFDRKYVGTYKLLPKITPFPLQERFHVVDGQVSVLLRDSYFDLHDSILSSSSSGDTKGLYITGPIGIGKSYLLYMFAAQCRLSQDRYVTYINDCSWWREDPIQFLLKELVLSFGCVSTSELDVPKMAEGVSAFFAGCQDPTGALTIMIEKIYSFVCKSGKQWFVVIDQLNALYSPESVAHKFPFTMINVLNRKQNVTVVLSASANNEGYPLGLKKYGTYIMKTNQYSENEYCLWCKQHEYDPKNHIMEEAFFWSGGIPLELDKFHRTHAESPEAKLSKFVNDRMNYFAEIHTKYTDNITRLSESRMSTLIECIARLSLHIEPPPQSVGMDKQLMCIVSGKICALNPLCYEVLLKNHRQHVQEPLNLVTSSVLSDVRNYPNDTKGRILEQYLISVTKLKKAYYFLAEQRSKSSKKLTFSGEISAVVRFKGKSLPASSSFSKGQTALFVPFSSQYPGIDYFIWDHQNGKLFAVQITVCRPISKHRKSDPDLLRAWADCFQVKDVQILWVVPGECVTRSCIGKLQENNYIVRLESLANRYSALTNLQLQQGGQEDKSSDSEPEETSEKQSSGGVTVVPNRKRAKRM